MGPRWRQQHSIRYKIAPFICAHINSNYAVTWFSDRTGRLIPIEPRWEKQKGNKSKMIKKQRKLKTRITHGSESETQYWSGWYWRLCTVLVMPCLSLGWFFFVSFRSNACQRRRSSSAHQSDDGDRSPNNGQVWWLNCIACPSGDRSMPGRCYRAFRCPALLWPLMMKRMSQSRAGIDL